MPTALEFQPGAIADERELRAFDASFISLVSTAEWWIQRGAL